MKMEVTLESWWDLSSNEDEVNDCYQTIAESSDSDQTKRLGSFSDSEYECGSNTVLENSSNKALYVTKDSSPGSKTSVGPCLKMFVYQDVLQVVFRQNYNALVSVCFQIFRWNF